MSLLATYVINDNRLYLEWLEMNYCRHLSPFHCKYHYCIGFYFSYKSLEKEVGVVGGILRETSKGKACQSKAPFWGWITHNGLQRFTCLGVLVFKCPSISLSVNVNHFNHWIISISIFSWVQFKIQVHD